MTDDVSISSSGNTEIPAVEFGLYALQAKLLAVIFDSCRDYAQHELLRCHPKYGLYAQISDPRQKLCTDFFISPDSFWMYKQAALPIIEPSSKRQRAEEEFDPQLADQPSLLITNEVLYHKLKNVAKNEEVWCRLFEANSADSVPQLELLPFDKKTRARAAPIIYRPPASWSDIIESQRLGYDLDSVPRGLFTHGIWIPSAELTHALNRVDLMDDSRVTIAIRGQCLILFASQHGYETAHIHGKAAIQDEWLTPLEQDLQPITTTATAIPNKKHKKKHNNTTATTATETITTTGVRSLKLSNLPVLSVVCSLKINFCNKTANNSSDKVLIALSATNPEEGVLLYFPLRGMKHGSFSRYRVAAPPAHCPYHHMTPANYIPPEAFQCTLPLTKEEEEEQQQESKHNDTDEDEEDSDDE